MAADLSNAQIDVAVNATESGVIKEFLVKEEDTVTVGQGLVRIEVGAEPSSGAEKPASEGESKPAGGSAAVEKPSEPPTSDRSAKEAPAAPKEPAPPAAPEPKKVDAPKPPVQPSPSKAAPAEGAGAAPVMTLGGREERRVRDTHSTSAHGASAG